MYKSSRIPAAIVAAAVALMSLPQSSHAQTNMLFILDGSNSMWGQTDGVAKIVSAQEVLSDLLAGLSTDINVGLMAYGHRDKSSCTDIEILSALGADSRDALTAKIWGIQPKGKTPIGAALAASETAFSGKEGENNQVVLISDGVETCDADPCAVAGTLAAAGIKARIHVIGFDVGENERLQLECIAKAGNGLYLTASNTDELHAAVAKVTKTVEEAEPAWVEIFRDDFDGDYLGEDWEVLNPNPDAYIVEDGSLLTIIDKEYPSGLLNNDEVSNLFLLENKLPKGDWIVTVKFLPEIQTVREHLYLAIYTDSQNYLMGEVFFFNGWDQAQTDVRATKVSRGNVTEFRGPAMPPVKLGGSPVNNADAYLEFFEQNLQEVYLRISKTGRSYIVSTKIVGALTTADGAEPQWIELQKLTSLRSPGKGIAVGSFQRPVGHPDYDIKGGESLILIDSVTIEVPATE